MRLLTAASVLALLTTAAHAQLGQVAPSSTLGQSAASASAKGSKSDSGQPRANDKAYNAALQNLPNKQYDPWHGVR